MLEPASQPGLEMLMPRVSSREKINFEGFKKAKPARRLARAMQRVVLHAPWGLTSARRFARPMTSSSWEVLLLVEFTLILDGR